MIKPYIQTKMVRKHFWIWQNTDYIIGYLKTEKYSEILCAGVSN